MKKIMTVLLCCGVMPVWAGDVSFSKPQVSFGESVDLIFSSETPIQTPPDLTSVQKHFQISGQQQRMNSSVVNGRVSQSYQLIYTVFPKQKGTIDLTGLTLNNEELTPISLVVTAAGQATDNTGVLELTGSVQQSRIYQGESVVYTLRLNETVGITEGAFQPPEVTGARVFPLGELKTTTEMRDGKPVRVAERSFLITPEQSGVLTIPPATFSGVAPSNEKRSRRPMTVMADFFDNDILFGGLQPQRQIFLQTQPVQIDVAPQPADWQGWWLPSTEVLLSEQYTIPDEVRAGAPLERRVVLSARGVDGDGLPLIAQPASGALSVYPGSEKRQTQTVNKDLLGTEDITFVIVPSAAGRMTIPAIRIPWFDTVTKERKVATLPEKVIDVLPATGKTAVSAPPSVTRSVTVEPAVTAVGVSEQGTLPSETVVLSPMRLGLLFGGGVLAGLLGAFGAMWFILKRRSKPALGALEPVEKRKKKKKPLPDLYPF